MMEKLERSHEMEAAERAKLEAEIRNKQEEVQRIQSEVEAKDAEARMLQKIVEADRYNLKFDSNNKDYTKYDYKLRIYNYYIIDFNKKNLKESIKLIQHRIIIMLKKMKKTVKMVKMKHLMEM
jgi:hypothetical protein